MDQLSSIEQSFRYLGTLSVITFILSLLLLPFLLSRASVDYFLIHAGLKRQEKCGPSLGCLLVKILKNSLGCLLLGAGIAMLFLPGQGLLTIILALTLLDLPGKPRLIARAIARPGVRKGLNWIRKKAGKPPFHFNLADEAGRTDQGRP